MDHPNEDEGYNSLGDNEDTHRHLTEGTHNQSVKLASLFTSAKEKTDLREILRCGITDIWLPIPNEILPEDLGPGATLRLRGNQLSQLSDTFDISDSSPDWGKEHFNLSREALDQARGIPKSLKYQKSLGTNNSTQAYVAAVKRTQTSEGVYALKRIPRKKGGYHDAKHQMRYIQSELGVLKKIDHRHCVKLVASYTDLQAVGILMYPVADHNLEQYLDDFGERKGDPSELAGFFGCLASTLQVLHYDYSIRHKDIKPQNILVKDGAVLFTDFGIALDWSTTGRTTTREETMRSPRYCAPEAASDQESRNGQTDIWSLGCVFLEMVTVLKGHPRRFVSQMLRNEPFHRNKEGINRLMVMLREEQTNCNNTPLDWIEKMLQLQKKDRPNSKQLKTMVLGAEDTGRLVFYGICCSNGLDGGGHSRSYIDAAPLSEPTRTSATSPSVATRSVRTTSDVSSGVAMSPPSPAPPQRDPARPPPPLNTQSTFIWIFEPDAQNIPGRTEWHKVKLFQHGASQKNWIAQKFAQKLGLTGIKQKDCVLEYEQRKFNSDKAVTLSWRSPEQAKTRRGTFLIATETKTGGDCPFKVLAGADLIKLLGIGRGNEPNRPPPSATASAMGLSNGQHLAQLSH